MPELKDKIKPHKGGPSTKAQRIEAIIRAIAEGAKEIDEVAERVGLSPITVYQYSSAAQILPKEFYKRRPYGKHIPEANRIKIINQSLAKGVNSLEELCKRTHLMPQGLRKICDKNDLKLPHDLIPYRYNPEFDVLIDQGLSLPEIAQEVKKTHQAVQQYIEASRQYEYWQSKRREAKETPKIEAQQKKQVIEKLVYVLETRVEQLAKAEGWAQQKAIEFQRSLAHTTHRYYSYEKLVKLFQRYESAKNKDKLLSLEELGKPLDISFVSVGWILRKVRVEPMYGKLDIHKTPKQKKDAIIKISRLGMTNPDTGYFLDLPEYTPSQMLLFRGIKHSVKPYITRSGRYHHLTYRLASQIYEGQAAGFKRSEIAELLDTNREIIRYAIDNKHKIAPKIIKALRIAYSNTNYNKPYKTMEKK